MIRTAGFSAMAAAGEEDQRDPNAVKRRKVWVC
jgi:hypothetical protein